MKKIFILTVLIFITQVKANAAEVVTINKELWLQLKTAMSTISMPLSAHQQIQQLLDNVEKEATRKENMDNKK
jgi:hypothetical protein